MLNQKTKSQKWLPLNILRDDKERKENLGDVDGGVPPNARKVVMSTEII